MVKLVLVGLLALGACTASQDTAAVCAADPAVFAVGQVGASLAPAPGVAVAGAVDAALVHPIITAACAKP